MIKAKHDRLLAALIAKLPAEAAPWPCTDRVAWLRMMAMAFDVVYGPGGGIRVSFDHAGGDDRDVDALHHEPVDHRAAAPPAPGVAKRFYIDRDGFAMGDGRPIAMEDLPPGAILWDERAGIECGDASAILWRDIGTSRRSLPPGITLRPLFDES
jgi:hypothetical protein